MCAYFLGTLGFGNVAWELANQDFKFAPPPHMRTAEERPEWCDLPGGVFRSLSQGSVFSLWERLFLIQFYLHVKGIIYLVLNYFFLEDSTERSCVCTCTHPHSHTHYF
jgi:hypothetical protein